MDPSHTTYTDCKGNTWDLHLTLDGALRIDSVDYSGLLSEGQEFSILTPEKETLNLLLTDINLLFTVIFALVRPQVVKNLGVDPEEETEKAIELFRQGIDGNTIEAARDTFWGALTNFFPERKIALQTYLQARKKVIRSLTEKMEQSGEAMQQLLEKTVLAEFNQLQEELKEGLGQSFTES
jgi:hypothetical protein